MDNGYNYKTYIEQALRTEAPPAAYEAALGLAAGDRVQVFAQTKRAAVAVIIARYIAYAEWVDQLKKFLFYGKGEFPMAYPQPAPDTTVINTNPVFLSSPTVVRAFHAALGLITEAGEILEAIFTAENEASIDGKNLLEESGDAKWYGALLDSVVMDLNPQLQDAGPDEIFHANIRKLRARYPDKFLSHLAITRDLMAESAMMDGCYPRGVPATLDVEPLPPVPQRRHDDMVNHPAHYGGDTVYEVIKVINAWELNFALGSAVKYIYRHGKKPGADALEDLKKARFYLDSEIKALEKGC